MTNIKELYLYSELELSRPFKVRYIIHSATFKGPRELVDMYRFIDDEIAFWIMNIIIFRLSKGIRYGGNQRLHG